VLRANKLRATVAILAAASSMAVATGPITSTASAKPGDGRYQKSAEAKRKDRCQDLRNVLHDYGMIADDALADGDNEMAGKLLEASHTVLDIAKGMKCSWA
jgi:hypothetical protein